MCIRDSVYACGPMAMLRAVTEAASAAGAAAHVAVEEAMALSLIHISEPTRPY